MEAPGFWDDREAAEKVLARRKALVVVLNPCAELAAELGELEVLEELSQNDPELAAELTARGAAFERRLTSIEFRALMSEPFDKSNCYVSIQAGAGGTDAADWAEMLLRMYSRWCEAQGYDSEILEAQAAEEAGLRRVTVKFDGPYAYGHLRNEIGVHRLVRHSPFDAAGRRHTAFASVDVVPEVAEVGIEIDEGDLRIDTYRAGGAGGQHVNKTDSAVRITHLPTGLVVQCQSERSQHRNKRTALALLQARLYREEERKREAELSRLYGEKGEIAWGNQIRSYVLQPYTLVKDHRTGEETGSVQYVLDGAIDRFIEAHMKHRLAQRERRDTKPDGKRDAGGGESGGEP